MHQGDGGLVVVDGVLDGLAHQALGAFLRDRLDADAGGLGEADLRDAQLLLQEVDELLRLVGLGLVLDAGVDVLGVLAEDHHVGLVGLAHRRGHAVEVLHGPQADVEVELLTQGHVERADAAANRRGERALDGDDVFTQHVQRLVGQPHVGTIDLGGLLAGVDLHPVDLALAAIGLLHGGIHHLQHHRRDVEAGAIPLDVGHDGVVRHVEGEILVDGDLLALIGHLDVLVHGLWTCSAD